MKDFWRTVKFWHCHNEKYTFAESNSLTALSNCCQFACPQLLLLLQLLWARTGAEPWHGLSMDPLQETEAYYEASMLRTLLCSAVTRCAVGESLGFITVDCVNQKEHQQIFTLLSWQLISTEAKRLSWRYICLGVHGCIADIRNLLILLVEDDAIVPRNCCCSGMKCK